MGTLTVDLASGLFYESDSGASVPAVLEHWRPLVRHFAAGMPGRKGQMNTCLRPQSLIVLMVVASILIACGGAPVASPASNPPSATTAPAAAVAEPTPVPVATQSPSLVPPTNTPIASTETATAAASAEARVRLDSFTLDSQALKGNMLGDATARPVQVILPPGYATSNKRYPVVYYLHGFVTNTSARDPMLRGMEEWFRSGASDFSSNPTVATGDLVETVQQGMQNGATQDMILVFPNAVNALGGTFYIGSPANGDVETYLTKEMVDYLDSHYRTLPQRESRGVAGCSTGGDGTVHLALRYPDVYSVAASQSGLYFYDQDPWLAEGTKGFTKEPTTLAEILRLPEETEYQIAVAAAVAPNADNLPWGFNMPYTIVNGKSAIAPGFIEKAKAADLRGDVEHYLAQPTRLNGLLIQHGKNDPLVSVDFSHQFDQLLTETGIAHEFDDSFDSHCTFDMVPPMLKFMSDHLTGEEIVK